jgi:cobalamin biosynthetic protein CobC
MAVRDHGGNLDWAMRHYGGTDWIDLSTGINRAPYPVGPITAEAWTCLPTRAAIQGLIAAARAAYGTAAPMVTLSGAQGAIQMIPRLCAPGLARVVGPTYNEHAACLRAAGWRLEEVAGLDALAGADLAVVVNPNNPDGRFWQPQALLDFLPQVGRLVVDESFADPTPHLSLAAQAGRPGLIVLRSFGKFYGLAGLRLGFALGSEPDIAALTEMAGPWPVAGAAIEIATRALTDSAWSAATVARLADEVARLDAVAVKIGWQAVGGTHLFRLYDTPDAPAAQDFLARHQVWSRIFPYSPNWIRLGLPGLDEWRRIQSLGQP